MKRLKKWSKVPGNDLVSDNDDMKLIESFDSELVDINKWIRFKTMGGFQGTQGVYGYCIDNITNEIEFYFIEMYSFQSKKSLNKKLIFRNIYIIHQIDENQVLMGNDFCLEGGNEHPFTTVNALKSDLNISPSKKLKLNVNFESLKQQIGGN